VSAARRAITRKVAIAGAPRDASRSPVPSVIAARRRRLLPLRHSAVESVERVECSGIASIARESEPRARGGAGRSGGGSNEARGAQFSSGRARADDNRGAATVALAGARVGSFNLRSRLAQRRIIAP